MRDSDPIRLGVVGCGDVFNAYMELAHVLEGQGVARVEAACDHKEARRDELLTEHGIRNFTTDYRQLVNSPDVDLVLVLTGMQNHAEITLAALEAGKHVLVEKPMGVTVAEGRLVMDRARQSPGKLMVAPHVVLSPTYQAIWHRLRDGDIGRVMSARARYGWSGGWWGHWYYRGGGGALFDLGVYNLTSLIGFLGPVKRVTAFTGVAIPTREVNGEVIEVEATDNAQVILDFGQSVFGAITTGFTIQKYRGPAIELYGSEGTVQMLGDDWAPQGYELWRNDVGAWQLHLESDPTWRWTDGLRHFVECIRRDSNPLVTVEMAYHVLEVMIKAEEAGSDGVAREIESTFEPFVLPKPSGAQPGHLAHDPGRKHQLTQPEGASQ